MDLLEVFISLGYSDREYRAYIALLKSGGGYVSTLAKRENTQRVGLYYTLESLVKKGAASCVQKSHGKFFIPSQPERLLNIQKEKSNLFELVLPTLKSLEHTTSHKPNFIYCDKIDEIDVFLDEVAHAKEVFAYANFAYWLAREPRRLTVLMQTLLKYTQKASFILPFDSKVQAFLTDFLPRDSFSFVTISPLEFPFSYDVIIAPNGVGILFFEDNKLRLIQINSQEYIKSQKAIFDLAWLGATRFVV